MSLAHTFGLFTDPDKVWQQIREKPQSLPKLYLGHIVLFALIPVIAGFYGTTQIGWQIGDGQVIRLTTDSALPLCALLYTAIVIGTYIMGRFIDFFAATYGVNEQKPKGITLAAYTATPMLFAGVIAIYPVIWLNMLVGLAAIAYSVYLLYEGLPILMKIPADRGFMFASSIVTVGLVMLVGLLAITVVIWSMGIGPVYTN